MNHCSSIRTTKSGLFVINLCSFSYLCLFFISLHHNVSRHIEQYILFNDQLYDTHGLTIVRFSQTHSLIQRVIPLVKHSSIVAVYRNYIQCTCKCCKCHCMYAFLNQPHRLTSTLNCTVYTRITI